MDDFLMQDQPDNVHWRGCPMREIYHGWDKFEQEQTHEITGHREKHAVLFNPLYAEGQTKPPPPRVGNAGVWDSHHVKLPTSPNNEYVVMDEDQNEVVEKRWEFIEKTLLQPIWTSKDLEAAVLKYNSKYKNVWKFTALHSLLENDAEPEDSAKFFEETLPKIISLAINLPNIVKDAIPLLKQGSTRSISLTQQQIACLLANAFLCTFPRRNTNKKRSEYSSYPDINFNRLFQSSGESTVQKIKCIINYFRRVTSKMPVGVVTFVRRSKQYSDAPDWSVKNEIISKETTPFHITSSGTIEDDGKGLIQVDFANKYIGGGVLGGGCVQEEIRFVICPELLVSKLFTESLKPLEALLMIGCEQFCTYTGYASSFCFEADYVDETPRDPFGRRNCSIVAIDALCFSRPEDQFRADYVRRELNKAYVGFFNTRNDRLARGIASGNWGCGAFGGDAKLKALLQIMVCCVVKRPLVYFTFRDENLRDEIYEMYLFLCEKKMKISQLWHILMEFRIAGHSKSPEDLYKFITENVFEKTVKVVSNLQKKPTPTLTEFDPLLFEVEMPKPKKITEAQILSQLNDNSDEEAKASENSACNLPNPEHSYPLSSPEIVPQCNMTIGNKLLHKKVREKAALEKRQNRYGKVVTTTKIKLNRESSNSSTSSTAGLIVGVCNAAFTKPAEKDPLEFDSSPEINPSKKLCSSSSPVPSTSTSATTASLKETRIQIENEVVSDFEELTYSHDDDSYVPKESKQLTLDSYFKKL